MAYRVLSSSSGPASVVLSGTEQKKQKAPRQYCNPIYLALEWQQALEYGGCSSSAELARTMGFSRARVTQILRLLWLSSEVIEILMSLGDRMSEPIVTEHSLRPVVNLPPEEQKRRIDNIVRGK